MKDPDSRIAAFLQWLSTEYQARETAVRVTRFEGKERPVITEHHRPIAKAERAECRKIFEKARLMLGDATPDSPPDQQEIFFSADE